jgi:hypothetical protein
MGAPCYHVEHPTYNGIRRRHVELDALLIETLLHTCSWHSSCHDAETAAPFLS